MSRTRMGLVLGLLPALALAVAACGGDDKGGRVASLGGSATPTTSGSKAGGGKDLSNDLPQALAWARCMRQHGINLPDLLFSGGNIVQRTPDRAVRNSAKFKAAEQACKQYLPHGPPTQADSQMLQQMLAFARCMRQHGINIPDPQKTEQGQQLPPGMSRNDPRLEAAEQACQRYGSLPPPKPGGGGR